MATKRLGVTNEAKEVIKQLKSRYGELLFHLSGGCCDGTSPMCFERSEFKIGDVDVKVGEISGCPFYMSRDQFKYLEYMYTTVDVTKRRGGGFSLEAPMGVRFIVESRIFTENELKDLEPV